MTVNVPTPATIPTATTLEDAARDEVAAEDVFADDDTAEDAAQEEIAACTALEFLIRIFALELDGGRELAKIELLDKFDIAKVYSGELGRLVLPLQPSRPNTNSNAQEYFMI